MTKGKESEVIAMMNFRKIAGSSISRFLFLMLTVVSLASASNFGPKKRPGPGGDPISVAEPAAIILLGAGLVSLGFYAKKKLGKKQ
jgi:hypothetical protein